MNNNNDSNINNNNTNTDTSVNASGNISANVNTSAVGSSGNTKKKSIINMSFAEVKALCVELGYPEFHASQILDFIYKRNVLSFDDISPLPKSLREKLEVGYYIHNCSIKSIETDESNTKKLLISLYDNKEIEAVILNKDERITFCLSSQVGCAYGCKFCATGKMGFKRNLTSEEILAQFLLLRHEAKSVNSIVFMGMGEPLANAKNVFAAIREINNYKGFNLGIRHITISTVGEVAGIKSLMERDLDVRLAVSLHSLKEDVRSSIMPINKKYPLKRLLPILKRYSSMGKRIVTFEWTLIDGVNDTVNDAYRLVNLKRELPFKVNLIALNPVEGSAFRPSSKDNMKRFAKILTDNGVTVVQRFKQGQKILAGCGQLAIKSEKDKRYVNIYNNSDDNGNNNNNSNNSDDNYGYNDNDNVKNNQYNKYNKDNKDNNRDINSRDNRDNRGSRDSRGNRNRADKGSRNRADMGNQGNRDNSSRDNSDYRNNKNSRDNRNDSRPYNKNNSRKNDDNRGKPYNRSGGENENRGRSYNRSGGENENRGRSYNRSGGENENRGRSYNRSGVENENRGRSYNRSGVENENRGRSYNRSGGENENRGRGSNSNRGNNKNRRNNSRE